MTDRLLHEETSLQALEHLHIRMMATAKESNSFQARFHYGGLVAVVALLNVDLVLLKTPIKPSTRIIVLSVTAVVLVILSVFYFRWIAAYTLDQDRNYRKTKHKYELLLYGLLYHASAYELIRELEHALRTDSGSTPCGPPFKTFDHAAQYLHAHHSKQLAGLKRREWVWLQAMAIVGLVLLIRITWILFASESLLPAV